MTAAKISAARTRPSKAAAKRTTIAQATANPGPAAAVRPATPTVHDSIVEAKPAPPCDMTAETIAEAAYFLWLKRGGNEIVNWLEAEAMLRQQTETTAANA